MLVFCDGVPYKYLSEQTQGNKQMALSKMNVEWKYVKTYATEAALNKKIEQEKNLYPEHNDRFTVIRTPEGRWTALVMIDRSRGGYLGRYDFMKV